MKKKMKQEDGFTLLETLIVLLVASLLMIVPTLSMGKMVETLEIDFFFRELTSNLTLMQNHAILSGKRTTIRFWPLEEGGEIQFRADRNHVLNRIMSLDSPHYSFRRKEYEEFSFLAETGNISGSDTLGFNTSQGQYVLTYLLGSGRFDIKKEAERR